MVMPAILPDPLPAGPAVPENGRRARADPDGIAALVATLSVPLNIPSAPTVSALAALCVRRIRLGSLLHRKALAAAAATASAVRDGRPVEPEPLSCAQVQASGTSAGTPRPSHDAYAG